MNIGTCVRCGQHRDEEEIIVNFELCNECFEERCPCHDGLDGCPLHQRKDVILFDSGKVAA